METNNEPAAVMPVQANENGADAGRLALAIVAGLGAAIAGAVVWAAVTVATNYELGIMAVAVGFITGKGISAVARSTNPLFGVAGAVCSLLGCLLGNLLSAVGFFAAANHTGYFDALSAINPALAIHLMTVMFRPMDLLFYAIGIYEGYRFAVLR
jgi:hypothetical protein